MEAGTREGAAGGEPALSAAEFKRRMLVQLKDAGVLSATKVRRQRRC